MISNYYDEAREIARLLEVGGRTKLGHAIVEVIEAGFTATEILTGISWNLRKIMESDPGLPDDLARRMNALAAAIDGALRR